MLQTPGRGGGEQKRGLRLRRDKDGSGQVWGESQLQSVWATVSLWCLPTASRGNAVTVEGPKVTPKGTVAGHARTEAHRRCILLPPNPRVCPAVSRENWEASKEPTPESVMSKWEQCHQGPSWADGESQKDSELSGLGPTVLGHQPARESGAEECEKLLEADKLVDSPDSPRKKHGPSETLLDCEASSVSS